MRAMLALLAMTAVLLFVLAVVLPFGIAGHGLLVTAATAGEAGRADGWEETTAVPEWVVAPPAREGWVRVVSASRSNLLHLVLPPGGPSSDWMRSAVTRALARRLAPVLGADAAAAAERVGDPSLVRKAFHHRPARPGEEEALGAAYYTGWLLFEAPVDGVLAAVKEEKRAAARAAIATVAPTPVWEKVEDVPAWVAAPAAEEGRVPVVVETESNRDDVARAYLVVHADHGVSSALTERLASVMPREEAHARARAASSEAVWRRSAHRVRAPGLLRRGNPGAWQADAWALWDVPLAPLLRDLPADRADAARAALFRAR
jgi:hypothetical protein